MTALPRDNIWAHSALPLDRRSPGHCGGREQMGAGGGLPQKLHSGRNENFPKLDWRRELAVGGEGPKCAKKWQQNRSDHSVSR